MQSYSNILVIDDEWIVRQKITLYHLLACTDVLISDYSSVIIDYILLDQPIVCICTDYEEYKKTQGLYFDKHEEWIPTELILDQDRFFIFLSELLSTGIDPYKEKRLKLKKKFFTHHDANSAERLAKHIFQNSID